MKLANLLFYSGVVALLLVLLVFSISNALLIDKVSKQNDVIKQAILDVDIPGQVSDGFNDGFDRVIQRYEVAN